MKLCLYHLNSCGAVTVILRKNLLYFFSSSRSDVFFRFCRPAH